MVNTALSQQDFQFSLIFVANFWNPVLKRALSQPLFLFFFVVSISILKLSSKVASPDFGFIFFSSRVGLSCLLQCVFFSIGSRPHKHYHAASQGGSVQGSPPLKAGINLPPSDPEIEFRFFRTKSVHFA